MQSTYTILHPYLAIAPPHLATAPQEPPHFATALKKPPPYTTFRFTLP